MFASARRFLFVAVVSSIPAQSLLAQTPELPGQPVPVVPQQPQPQPQPGPFPPIPVPRYEPAQPPPGNVPIVPATAPFVADPFGPPVTSPQPVFGPGGLYGSFEISLLFPDVHGSLSGPVNVFFPHIITVGSSNFDTTGSPRVEVGYRLPEGAVAVVYRSIVSQGGTNIANFDLLGAGFLHSRLNFNVVDIDYVSPEYNLVPFWYFSWRGGVRTAAAYYDNQITGNLVQQHATNNFIGAGPHATVEFARSLDLVPGLAVVTKLDGAVLFGNVSQSFDETITFPMGPAFGDTTRFNHTQTVPVLTFDLGLSYTPPCMPNWSRFGFGYQYEYWWDVGTSGNSHSNFGGNALYFRGEFNF
ncbi:MAG TPA: Lpg1974 family pore-forming outer membrane protein [Gemmataceae bacterium]|nr:Lpg1974 family pore-forming outer membrane protein [Gemmataceae bacterium]